MEKGETGQNTGNSCFFLLAVILCVIRHEKRRRPSATFTIETITATSDTHTHKTPEIVKRENNKDVLVLGETQDSPFRQREEK
jgi:hypothetical protein